MREMRFIGVITIRRFTLDRFTPDLDIVKCGWRDVRTITVFLWNWRDDDPRGRMTLVGWSDPKRCFGG